MGSEATAAEGEGKDQKGREKRLYTPVVQVTATLTFDDWMALIGHPTVQGRAWARSRRVQRQWAWTILWVLALGAYGTARAALAPEPPPGMAALFIQQATLGAVLVGAAAPLIAGGRRERGFRRRYAEMVRLGEWRPSPGPFTFALRPEGMIVDCKSYSVRWGWEQVKEVAEVERHILFILEGGQGFPVPRAALETSGTAVGFLACAKEYLEEGRRARDAEIRALLADRDWACPGCGYNMRGSGMVCPECGRDVSSDELSVGV